MNNILVTGADGFIGSHLTELLVDQGYRVKALSQYNSFNNWGWLEDVNCKDDIEIITGDIRDPHYCIDITKDVDIVFHLAALIAIPYSYVAPDHYVDTNIKGTLNICQASKQNNIDRLVHTSTSEVYGTAKYIPIDEKHPLQPQSPYSASKIGADAMAASFYNAFDLPVSIARPFNTFGPRQSARAVIPTIISQLLSGKKEIELGDVTPTRDFTYVEETCRGLIEIARSKDSIGQTINIGSNREISILDLFKSIKELMSVDAEIISDKQRLRPETSEVFRLFSDNTKLFELTAYKPSLDLEEGLKKTIDWFSEEENLKYYKADIYNV